MALVTCPVCLKEDVPDDGKCPECHIPVGEYLKVMPSFKDPDEKALIVCRKCGASFEREHNKSCPSCGTKLPKSRTAQLNSCLCPLCQSAKTEKFDWDYDTQPFTYGYWCRNCGNVFKERGGDIIVRRVNRGTLYDDDVDSFHGCAFLAVVIVVAIGALTAVSHM